MVQVTQTEAAFCLVSYYREDGDKATDALPKSKSPGFSPLWVVAEGKEGFCRQ